METPEKTRFLEDWLINEAEYDDDMMFRQGLTLGIDFYASRMTIMLELSPDLQKGASVFESKYRIFEKIIQYSAHSLKDALALVIENRAILLMSDRQDERPRAVIKDLIRKCSEATGLSIYGGMETRKRKGMDIRTGVRCAERALLANKLMDDAEDAPYRYTSMFWYSFIPDISDNMKRKMIRQCFAGCTDEEIRELLPVLYLFYDCEKDYRSTAELLHMHPNTLRYRMERLQKKSGIDPRSPDGASRYLLTFYLWVFLHPEDFKKWKTGYGVRLDKNLYKTVSESRYFD